MRQRIEQYKSMTPEELDEVRAGILAGGGLVDFMLHRGYVPRILSKLYENEIEHLCSLFPDFLQSDAIAKDTLFLRVALYLNNRLRTFIFVKREFHPHVRVIEAENGDTRHELDVSGYRLAHVAAALDATNLSDSAKIEWARLECNAAIPDNYFMDVFQANALFCEECEESSCDSG